MIRIVFLSLLLMPACSSEPSTPSEGLPSDDAIRLALRHQSAGILPDMDLAALYDDILERGDAETPASRCTQVHSEFPNSLDVILDEETAAIWRRGDRMTGVVSLDTLVADYRVTITPRAEPHVQNFLLGIDTQLLIPGERDEFAAQAIGVRTDRLAAVLAEIDVVLSAQPGDAFYDGPNIELSEADPETWQLLYDYGWGDCPSGCIYHRYWRTRVPKDPALPAELIESFGSPDDIDDPDRAERLRTHVIEACGSL